MPWSRPREDQPTTEMRAGALAVADSVRTAEFESASEPVTEKIDRDEVRAARGGYIDRRDRAVPTAPGPVVAQPIDDMKTDVMLDPPDFAAEYREAEKATNGPRGVRQTVATRKRPRARAIGAILGIAIAVMAVALVVAMTLERFAHR